MQTATQGSTKVNTHTREILRIALPIIASNSIPQIHFFTNTFFLSKYSNNALAANALAGVFFLVLQMSCYGLANGIQIYMSRRAGEDKQDSIGYIFSQGALLGILFSVIVAIVSYVFAPMLFSAFVKNESIKQLAIDFIKTRSVGLPILFLGILFIQFFISIKKSKLIIIGTLVSTIFNIFFDYVLINGNGGFVAMGIKGAAVASIFADYGMVTANIIIILLLNLHKTFGISLKQKFDTTILKQISNLSAPIILQYIFSIGSWELFFIYVEHLDTHGNALAVSQILRSVFGIVGIMTWGLASTCNSMVSNLIGQNRKNEVVYLIKKIASISFLSTLAIGIVIFIFPNLFLKIYTTNNFLIDLGIAPLRVLILVTLLLSFSTIFFNGVLGTGNSKAIMLFEFVSITIYVIYIYFVIEKYKMSLSWAWGAEFVYWISLLSFSLWYLNTGKWKKKDL